MKKILFLTLLAMCGTLYAAKQPAMYFVYLHDKAATTYSLAQPDSFLSQRAIDRRTRLSISVDSADLPVCAAYTSLIAQTGATLLHTSRWMNGVMVYATETQLTDILALACVDSAQQIRPSKQLKRPHNRVPRKLQRAKNSVIGQNHQIGVDSLHNAGFRGKGLLIAVIDAGFPSVNTLAGFDSLRNRGGITYTYDFVNDTSYVYHMNEHGTCVLSTMAFNLPDELVGTAPDADYMLLITENNSEEYIYESDLMICAFECADSAGADITTVSLGYFFTDDDNHEFTYANMNGRHFRCSRAATMAAQRGMIVCVAAGNEGYSDWHYIDMPGDADSILCVGGVDSDNIHSDFSSYGPSADGRIKPEVCARATGAVVASLYPEYGNVRSGNGTSFATPITAGAVASLMSAMPDVNPSLIRHTVMQTASQATNPDSILGYGVLNVWRAYRTLHGEPTSLDTPTERGLIHACISNELLMIDNYTGPFSLYDITGCHIISDTYDTPFPLPQLPSGIYLLRLSSETLTIAY